MAAPIRVTRTKAEARDAYDRLAPRYDTFGRFEDRYRVAGLRALDVREGERVLEIGYGTGKSLVDLATATDPEGQVAGIDISPRMRDVAVSRLRDAGLAGQVDLRVGDAAALPFDDGSFDAEFSAFTLELFDTPDIPAVLAEWRRVMVPGGRIGVVAMDMPVRQNLMERLYVQTHKWWPSVVDCRPIPVVSVLEDAGFTVTLQREMRMYGLAVGVAVARI